ncbi:MAG: hypothetical protein JST01_09700 [Cyanobacteria bacterium SZAS TMP-1]|nr:hypothetical protein [Cyanobacteria bacterium SZAS TMP-1]
MGSDKFELVPAQQCTQTEQGHFGEVLKDVYQGRSGVVARQETWTTQQYSALEHDLMLCRGDERQEAGPYNKTFLDMAFGGNVYSLGQDTRSLTVNGRPVEAGTPEYNQATAKIAEAMQSIDFNAPACAVGKTMGMYENLDQRD